MTVLNSENLVITPDMLRERRLAELREQAIREVWRILLRNKLTIEEVAAYEYKTNGDFLHEYRERRKFADLEILEGSSVGALLEETDTVQNLRDKYKRGSTKVEL